MNDPVTKLPSYQFLSLPQPPILNHTHWFREGLAPNRQRDHVGARLHRRRGAAAAAASATTASSLALRRGRGRVSHHPNYGFGLCAHEISEKLSGPGGHCHSCFAPRPPL